MPSLQSDERRRFIEQAHAMGVPPDRIMRDLAKFEGLDAGDAEVLAGANERTANIKAGLTPGGLTPQEQSEGKEFYTETVPRTAVAAGAGLAASPLTAGMSLPAAIAAETGLVGTADLAYQGVRRAIDPTRKVNPVESGEIGAASGLGTGVTRTGIDVLSRLAGIAPQFSRWFRSAGNVGRFNRTYSEPAKGAEYELGQRIKQAVEDYVSQPIPERAIKVGIEKQATAQGVTVPATKIIDALESAKIATPKTDVGEQLNAILSKAQGRFMNVKIDPADLSAGKINVSKIRSPRTNLSPTEVDEFLTKELDNRIYKANGEPKDAALAEAYASVRPKVREALHEALPPEARDLTSKIHAELLAREAAQKTINPELDSLETTVRNLFKPGNEAERRAVKYVGDKMGIDLEGAAFKLAQKRAFSPDERLAAKGMDALLELIRGAVARPAIKAVAPLQSLVGPAIGTGVAYNAEEGRVMRKKSQ